GRAGGACGLAPVQRLHGPTILRFAAGKDHHLGQQPDRGDRPHEACARRVYDRRDSDDGTVSPAAASRPGLCPAGGLDDVHRTVAAPAGCRDGRVNSGARLVAVHPLARRIMAGRLGKRRAVSRSLAQATMVSDEDTLHAESVGPRRRARMVAVQALYELDATSHEPETVLRYRFEDDQTPPAAAEYARQLVLGTRAHQPVIDAEITAAAPAWPLEQMSRVDKSILRLALFEMLYEPDVPPKVAINEAVEL